MKSRILVAVVGVPVLAYVVLFAPDLVMTLCLSVLAAIGGYELMKCVGANGRLKRAVPLAAGLTVVLPRISGEDILLPLLVVFTIMFFAVAVFEGGAIKLQETLSALFAFIVIPYAFSAFLRINDLGLHRAYLLLPFILSFACDTFAYFAGRAFGKHKLAPKVSPKKTVEGSIGGILGNVVCGLIFAFVMDRWFGGSIGYGAMALLALICSVVSQIGDLSFSLIKREFGVKDYSRLFLEHGGVLDRFDSVLFVAPVVELVMKELVR